jgi:hypothetical protein
MANNNDNNIRLAALATVSALVIAGMFLVPPIPQDLAYHEFADQRNIFGIPNFWNVVTNVPLVLTSLAGILILIRRTPHGALTELRPVYLWFFIGATLTGLCSAWYHLHPSNAALVWDRLPMTIAFMSFTVIIAGEYISVPAARRMLWPLIAVGILSVVYWAWTEAQGNGDLRPYAIVQFFPGLLIMLTLCLFRPFFAGNGYIWAMLLAYAVAKLAELLDEPIFDAIGVFSGHSLKHLVAAVGVLLLWLALRNRMPVGKRRS